MAKSSDHHRLGFVYAIKGLPFREPPIAHAPLRLRWIVTSRLQCILVALSPTSLNLGTTLKAPAGCRGESGLLSQGLVGGMVGKKIVKADGEGSFDKAVK